MQDLKELLLYHLEREPNLNTDQLIRLVGAKKNTVQKALRELTKKKLIQGYQIGAWTSYFWRLKGSKRLNEITKNHEQACADIYVALKSTGEDMLWISKDDQKKGFRFDRAFKIFDKQFFLELETGTHYDKRDEVIPKKIEHYLKLDGWFHVIFCVMDFDERITARRYGESILKILSNHQRGTQFLVTPFSSFSLDPLGNRLISPPQGVFSLESVPHPVHLASMPEDELISVE